MACINQLSWQIPLPPHTHTHTHTRARAHTHTHTALNWIQQPQSLSQLWWCLSFTSQYQLWCPSPSPSQSHHKQGSAHTTQGGLQLSSSSSSTQKTDSCRVQWVYVWLSLGLIVHTRYLGISFSPEVIHTWVSAYKRRVYCPLAHMNSKGYSGHLVCLLLMARQFSSVSGYKAQPSA